MSATTILHAGALAQWKDGGWRGVLVRGPSGAGKSDLALRAMAAGWRLVADDRVLVWASARGLYGRAPASLAGLVEARGVGVRPAAFLPWVRLGLVVDLLAPGEEIERVPAEEWRTIAGVPVRRIALFGRESSATAKLSLALQAATLGAGLEPAYQARLADEVEAPDAIRGLQEE